MKKKIQKLMKPKNVRTKVLIGARESTLHTLLKTALSHAEDGNVLFIAKTEIEELPSDLLRGGNANKDVLRRITFVYPTVIDDVILKCSEIHKWRKMPHTIVFSGMEDFLAPHPGDPKCAFLSALLLETCGVCAAAKKRQCDLYISLDRIFYTKNRDSVSTLLDLYFYDDVETVE